MTKTKNRNGRRVLSLLLLTLTIIALLFSLASCGGSEKKTYKEKLDGESDAKYVASIIAQNQSYRIRFLAASRGHDITAENFKDTDEIKPANIDAAKAVLKDIINEKRLVAGSKSEETFINYMNELDEAKSRL